MVGCQYGNKLICYNKLRQGAKWIMINDPPVDDSPSMLTMEMGTPVNDQYTQPEFVSNHSGFAKDHGIVTHAQPAKLGQGWNPEMMAGMTSSQTNGLHGEQNGWNPKIIRAGASQCLNPVQEYIYTLYMMDNL